MGRKRSAATRNFPPNLYLNSAGYYYYRNPHDKTSQGLGRDKAHAFSEARAANAGLATLKPSSLLDWVMGKKNYSLAEWVSVYKELWIAKSKPAESTLRNASGYLNRFKEAGFAWMKMEDIGTSHAAKYLEGIEQESGKGAATVMRARLSDVFRMAETQGVIKVGQNPVAATYTPDRTVKRERLTLEQFHVIYEKAPEYLRRAMNLALMTAQRRDDVASMLFADCKDGHLYIVQGKSRGKVRLQQDVRIRLAATGLSIADTIQACRDMIASRYMIHHTEHAGRAKPGHRVTSNGLSTAFTKARKAAEIVAASERTAPTFHEIRSLSERLYKKEYGAAFAQAMLGHKHAAMTAQYDDMRGQGYQVISAK